MDSTMLFVAVEIGSVEYVHKALARGIDVNSKDSTGDTALHLAFERQSSNEIVQCLLDAGADYNIFGRYRTALETCAKEDIAKIKILLNNGLNVNVRVKSGRTFLHYAAMKKDVDCMRFLIEQGAHVNARDDFGVTPLFEALNLNDFSPMELLLKKNANFNLISNVRGGRKSPLAYFMDNRIKYEFVSYEEFSNFFKFLLKYNVDLNARNHMGWSYIDSILYRLPDRSYVDIIKAFIVIGGANVNCIYTPDNTVIDGSRSDMTLLHFACTRIDINFIKLLIKHGANINSLDRKNRSPLFYAINAVDKNFTPYLDYELDIYDDLDPEELDPDDLSPGEKMKFELVHKKIISYLFKHNADVNTISINGRNILNCREQPAKPHKYLWKMIIQHLAKKNALGHQINGSLIYTIENERERNQLKYYFYFRDCRIELQKLKDQMFPSARSITFFNILTDDKQRLRQYAENLDLVADFKKIDFVSSYPIYGGEIKKRFTKIFHKKEILRQSASLISSWLPHHFDPDHLVIRKILSYFEFEELEELCENFSVQ